MANVKGITIEFRGETTKLSKALKEVRTDAKNFDKELGYIDNSLKFNPNNVELTRQKMKVLEQAAGKAEENTKDLKNELKKMKDNGVDETSEDYRELEREIIRAESKQKAYNKELSKLKTENSGLGKLSKKFETFGAKAQEAGEALLPLSTAGAAVDVALGTLAYKAGQSADDLNTLSKQTGLSTGTLQKYQASADLVDVSLDTMVASHTKLKKSMYNSQNGSKKLSKAFDTLGISVTDSNGELRSSEEVFDEAIIALGNMDNATERDALAMQIFGGNAKELNSLIADGGATYQKVAQIYDETGLGIVDQETLDKANEFNDLIDTIKLTGQAALAQIGSKLAGVLVPALEKVVGWVEKVAGWLGNLDPKLLAVIGVIAGIVAAIGPLLIIIGKLSTGIGAVMKIGSKLPMIFGALSGPVGIVIAVIAALIAIGVLLYKNWDKIKAKAKEIKDAVSKRWNELKDKVSATVKAIKDKVTEIWTAIKTKVTETVQAIKDKVTSIWTAIKTKVTETVKAIKDKVSEIWTAIKTKVSSTVTSIKEKVVSVWTAIKTKISELITAIKTKVSDVWTSIKDGVKTKVEAIKSSIVEKFTAIKTKVGEIITNLKTSISDKFTAIKDGIKNKIQSARESVVEKFRAIKTKTLEIINGLKSSISEKFTAIKEKMFSPIDKAREKIKSIVDRIKGIFSGLKLELPKFKLPHFKVDGGKAPWGIGGAGKAPSFDISWYKSGAIFNSPSLIGVGEAGPEAVLPIEKLKDWMQDMNGGITINVYASPGMDVNELANAVQQKLVLAQRQKAKAF